MVVGQHNKILFSILFSVFVTQNLYSVEFEIICCPNERFRGKPSPDQLLYTLAECNVDPKDAVYVGDMQVDMDCADRAGVDFIYAEYGYGDIECCWNRASSIESV